MMNLYKNGQIISIFTPHVHFQEYVEYYGGPGVQHIAMNTSDIITAVSQQNNLIDFACGCIEKAAALTLMHPCVCRSVT